MERADVTGCVVEVGPATVRGPRRVDESLVSVALECIDDDIALLDDQPVSVAAAWAEVFRSVLPDDPDGAHGAVLVCPTWWPARWIRTVTDAAAVCAATVRVRSRVEVLAESSPGAAVVEIAPEVVLVWLDGCMVGVEPRVGDPVDVATAVAAAADAIGTVLVDAPEDVEDAAHLADTIARHLRAADNVVTIFVGEWVSRTAAVRVEPVHPSPFSSSAAIRPWPAVAVVVATVALLLIGVAVRSELTAAPGSDVPMTLLVEGRVAVKVPAPWAVRRITAGAGSARLQVISPDGVGAVLVTQSRVGSDASSWAVAATLQRALDDQPAGVFSEFNPDDRQWGRQAVTYRETRDGRRIDWAVFVDGAVRIAIGCQSAPGAEQAMRLPCGEAVRSAHAVF